MSARAAILGLVVVVAACHQEKKTEAVPDASVAPVVTVVDAGVPEKKDEIRAAVLAWSDALDRHDLAALEAIYAPRVDLYGTSVPRAAAIATKKQAFARTPTFKQSIALPIAIEPRGETFVATFVKRSGPDGKLRDANAKLVLARGDGGAIVVTVETDAATEKRGAEASSCEAVAGRVVHALPQVKKLLAEDEKALGKDKHVGGIGPIEDPAGGFTASLGVHHPDRFESQIQYDVDAKGKLTVTVMGEDVTPPAAALAEVAKACAR
jgi:hypothetical protein